MKEFGVVIMLFQVKEGKVKQVKEKEFKLEKDIQNFVESNMNELLNLEFLATELSMDGFRIDSLAFDTEHNAFIIIEYKRGRNESLIDQGYTYLNILFDRKADFVLKYNEVKNKSLRIQDINWELSRIVFISPSFTEYQMRANNFKNIPIELIQIARYENDIIEIDKIEKNSNIKLETNNNLDDDLIGKVNKQIVVYSEDDHLSKANDETKELYYKFKDMIIEWGNVSVEAKKMYIAFKGINNIIDIVVQNKQLKIIINLKINELDDPKGVARDITNVGHWGNGDYEILLNSNSDFEYIMSLIKQSWRKNKK